LYVFWAACAYMVLVYGRLLLRLLGPDSDAQLATVWLAALGAEQLAELRMLALAAAEALAAVTLLDALWLLPNSRWLEAQLDASSVQATVFQAPGAGARVTPGRRAWTYLQHFKAVR
jgi:hypothetical protein